jgi:uncharacterized membrane protein YGL010W
VPATSDSVLEKRFSPALLTYIFRLFVYSGVLSAAVELLYQRVKENVVADQMTKRRVWFLAIFVIVAVLAFVGGFVDSRAD